MHGIAACTLLTWRDRMLQPTDCGQNSMQAMCWCTAAGVLQTVTGMVA